MTDMARSAASNDLTSLFGLKGRSYVITGGAQGIGLAISKAIAQVGGNVVAMDVQDKPKPEFLEFPEKFGVKASYIQTDVTNEASLRAAFERAVDSIGKIDGCVTCAGIAIEKPFGDHTWEEVRRVMDVNVSRSLLYLLLSFSFLFFIFCVLYYRACSFIILLRRALFQQLNISSLTMTSRSSEPTSHHNSQLSR